MKNISAAALAALTALALSACGGGGDASAPPPPPVPVTVPTSVTLTAPAKAELGEPTKFSSSAASLTGLQHLWTFGDGATSNEAAPSHSYAKAGDYEVVLKVSDSAGGSREVRSPVSVRAMANVRALECSGAANAGWCWQNPKPTGNRVNAVFFLDTNTGWRGGENGEIFKTTDSGTTWVRQNSGTAATIYGIRFLNATTGWAAGEGGVVLRTTDGGNTWAVSKLSSESSYSSQDLAVITPIDANTVYVGSMASGSSPDPFRRMYASKDGGVTWQPVTTAPHLITSTGKFWSLQNNTVSLSKDGGQSYTAALALKLPSGYERFDRTALWAMDDLRAVAYTRASVLDTTTQRRSYVEILYTTIDGGATWSNVDIAGAGSSPVVENLVSISADGKVLVSLGAQVKRSTDGGKTWAAMAPPTSEFTWYASVGDDDITALSNSGLWLSKDGGLTWTRLGNPMGSSPVTSAAFRRIEGSTLYLNGHLSKDEGQSWVRIIGPDMSDTYGFDVAFLDAKAGFILDPAGKLLATVDGGQTWTVRRDDLTPGGGSVHAIDGQTVVVLDNAGRLLRSSDRGVNWVTVPSNVRYAGVKFTKGMMGWGYQGDYLTGTLVATKDGGLTWTSFTPPPVIGLKDIHQSDVNNWVALGTKRIRGPEGYDQFAPDIAHTRDGGKTWHAASGIGEGQIREEMLSLTASDERTIWAVGVTGVMARSDDGGVRWQVVDISGGPTLRGIAFLDAQRGWAVGDYGTIKATTDGGKTWATQDSRSSASLSRIHIADGQTLWVSARQGGALLATATGGTR